MIRTADNVIVDHNGSIPTDAEPLDPIIEVCYLNTSNILEDDYMQVVFEDENDDISEEENDSPTDDKHAHQLIEGHLVLLLKCKSVVEIHRQNKIVELWWRAILVKHVLRLYLFISLSIVTLHCCPKSVQSIMANFFGDGGMRGKSTTGPLGRSSFPYDEGGVGIRNHEDVCMAFQYKQ
ncbi:hypothetical protein H5410_027654 [Solanum commersonii]|uniref:Uncharacterized protein n=1 Tax=Solanum commersonii TaxID=4109 RepID=A0A9J5Z0H4_SOLCO|nr:hypothetical protein H5410_027654 [Solanum commersonii]